MDIPTPNEQISWGKQLGEAFGGAEEKYSDFISLGVTIAANYFFLPSPTLFKKKMGSNNGKQGLQLE